MSQPLTSRTRKEYSLTRDQWQTAMSLPGFRGASVHETLGPNWKDIFWSPRNSPAVITKLTRAEAIDALAKKEPVKVRRQGGYHASKPLKAQG